MLSLRKELFVNEFLKDGNATQAVIRSGYSPNGANRRGAALLKDPVVRARIEEARAEAACAAGITRERVLREYAKLAFSDPRLFFNADGTLKHPTELDDDTAAALAQFEVSEELADDDSDEKLEPQTHGGALKRSYAKRVAGYLTKIKWSDKRAALDSIVKLQGWAKDASTLGTPQNPLTVLLDQLGNKSALPVQAIDPEVRK